MLIRYLPPLFADPASGLGPHGKVRFALLAFTCSLLALLICGCGNTDQASDESGGADSAATAEATGEAPADTTAESDKPKKKEKALKVDAGEVRKGELVIPVYADGVIRTPRSVEIRTKLAGELIQVLAEDGQVVKKGQLLARIDQRPYRLDLEENRYRHFQALSQVAAEADTFTINHEALSLFGQQRRDLEKLYARGSLTREEYQARLLELELAALQKGAFRQDVFEQRTGLAEARVGAERAKLNLENTEIRAPFAGTVQGLVVVPGEIVSVGSPICSIFNNNRLEAVVNVLEADLGNLTEGRPVLLAIPAALDTLQARVDVISPTLDQTSRTCEVIIRFDNSAGRYRPGMFVRAEIAGWIHPDKLCVPKAAVLTRENRPLVFKVNGDRAQWLYVDTGLENDRWIEILAVHSGGSLAPGEKVVVSDHLTLAHEAKISVRRTREPASRWAFAAAEAGATP
jgi:membrane fusion protein (multidrug efflux system)